MSKIRFVVKLRLARDRQIRTASAIAWRKSGHPVKLGFISLVLAAVIAPSWTQEPPPSRSQSMSKSLGLHTFPAKDQTAAQQQKDEMTCYDWARQDSGYDPIGAATAQAQTTPAPSTAPPTPSTRGAGAKGAAGGAAAGAVVGAVAGDAGKGAAIGATAGGIRGRRQAKRAEKQVEKQAQQQQQQQAQQQAQAKTETQQKLEGFKKAFGICMEAKGYAVK